MDASLTTFPRPRSVNATVPRHTFIDIEYIGSVSDVIRRRTGFANQLLDRTSTPTRWQDMRDTIRCRSRIIYWRWIRIADVNEPKGICRSGNRGDRNLDSSRGTVSIDVVGDTRCDLESPLASPWPSSRTDVLSSVVLLGVDWSGLTAISKLRPLSVCPATHLTNAGNHAVHRSGVRAFPDG